MNQAPPDHALYMIVVESDLNALDGVREFCAKVVGDLVAGEDAADILSRAQLSLVESVTNIVRHGEVSPSSEIKIQATSHATGVDFEITHEGDGFVPNAIPEIDCPLEGGMGLFLIHECASNVYYETKSDGRSSIRLSFDTNTKES